MKKMKRKLIVMLVIVLVTTCGTGIFASAATRSASKIGVARAKTIALNHAKLKASDVIFKKAKLDYDDGRFEYEVEFYNKNRTAKYEYDIDAYKGTILDYSIKRYNTNNSSTSTNYIGVDKAKTIAFNHAGVNAKNVYVKKAKLDYDDGRVKYEIEFYAGVREYEYEIDATSGAILEYDIEYRD